VYCNAKIGGNLAKVDPENELLIMATIQYMGSSFLLLQGRVISLQENLASWRAPF
jgi:hypothetical protein